MGFEVPQTGIIVCHVKIAPPHHPRFYIGRKYGRYQGSPLGNPFKIQSDEERPAALEKYRAWLTELMHSDTPAARQIEQIASVAALIPRDGQLALMCWCKPKPCPGDIVKEFVEARVEKMREGKS